MYKMAVDIMNAYGFLFKLDMNRASIPETFHCVNTFNE